jgi:hypothetical protein
MKNPELTKQLWLYEIKISTVLLLILFVSITWFVSESIFSLFITKYIAIFGFLFFGVVVGSITVGNAFQKEVVANTWSAQRMGSIKPSSLLLGKLLGPSLTSWGAGIFCLLIYLANTNNLPESLMNSAILCLIAVSFQATSLNKAIIQVFRERVSGHSNSIIFLLILMPLLLPHISDTLIPTWYHLKTSYNNPIWFSISYEKKLFTLSVLIFITCWSIFGAYRTLTLETGVKSAPWAYVLFILSMGLLVSGFSAGNGGVDALRMWLSCTSIIASVASYLAAISFTSSFSQYLSTLKYLKEKQFRLALNEAPLWLSASFLAITLGVFSTVMGVDPIFTNAKLTNTGSAALAIALLAFRDVLFLSFLQMRYSVRLSSLSFLFFLVIVNKLIPQHATETYLTMLTPDIFQAPLYVCVVTLLFTGLIGYMWSKTYQKKFKEITKATVRQS